MAKTASVAEVQQAGVTIEAEEAVAIAQQLIVALSRRDDARLAEPPYGPPSPSNVLLGDDGSIHCRACETTPAVSEIAILLKAMLPPQTRVHGALRYTIARALLDVDVPPFDSLADLSETLARYERGSRDAIIAHVMQRYALRRALLPLSAADRRRHPRTAELRRALREADARLYLQKVATDTVALSAGSRSQTPRRMHAGTACVAAGLVMIFAGEYIDRSHAMPAARDAEPSNRIAVDIALPQPALEPTPAHGGTTRALPDEARDTRRTNEERRAVTVARRRPPRQPSIVRTEAAARANTNKPGRSVLDRLRLRWLKNALTSL
jgi:hypothetical protein